MRQIWQIASGDGHRRYTDLFLEHDVMFIGPGKHGAYNEQVYRELVDRKLLSGQKLGMIRSIATKVKPGDIVLLRDAYRVASIGIVGESEYEHDDTFDDVFGWDLQHTKRVIWQRHLDKELANTQKEKPLFWRAKQIPTFTRVKDDTILEPIRQLFEKIADRPLKPMPAKLPDPLSLEELGEELFSKGLPNEAVDKVILAIQRQRRLAKWYDEYGKRSVRPTEQEVVAHMILPLLLALGWSEQLLAVEWHKIDLAAFLCTPTTAEHCCLVCEAKGLEHALQQKVFIQAISYADKLELNNCKKILLTDGIRFYLYQRQENDEWNEVPVGYLNVKLIRTNHVAPAGTNAVDTIMALTPTGINRISMNTEVRKNGFPLPRE